MITGIVGRVEAVRVGRVAQDPFKVEHPVKGTGSADPFVHFFPLDVSFFGVIIGSFVWQQGAPVDIQAPLMGLGDDAVSSLQ